MSYDIYGNYLRPGFCEVHPDVPEPYPCSECVYNYEQEKRYHEAEDAHEAWLNKQYDIYINKCIRDDWTAFFRDRLQEVE